MEFFALKAWEAFYGKERWSELKKKKNDNDNDNDNNNNNNNNKFN